MSIAGLYALVATCEVRGIIQDHPKRQLDELLPGPWALSRVAA